MLRSQTNAPQGSVADLPVSSLEDLIAGLWEELLGVSCADAVVEFDELGGTQTIYGILVERLQERVGYRPRLEWRSGRISVRMLADDLVRQVSPSPTIRLLQTGHPQTRIPLLFLHGDFTGAGLYSTSLAR